MRAWVYLFFLFLVSSELCNGQDSNLNPGRRIEDFLRLAEQGVAEAQFNLGICYNSGLGVTKDYEEAVKWYRKAAEQGFADAQFNLAVRYRDGKGVTKSYKEAYKWLVIASAQERTYLVALGGIDVLEDEMTFDQITEAEEEAAEFSPKLTGKRPRSELERTAMPPLKE